MKAIKNITETRSKQWNALVTLDVRNAFNTASWNLILEKLEIRKVSKYLINIISDYFRERNIHIAEQERIVVEAGVPQGSILEPTWNILYN